MGLCGFVLYVVYCVMEYLWYICPNANCSCSYLNPRAVYSLMALVFAGSTSSVGRSPRLSASLTACDSSCFPMPCPLYDDTTARESM